MITPEQVSDEAARTFIDLVAAIDKRIYAMFQTEADALTWAKGEIARFAKLTQLSPNFEARTKMARTLGL